MNSLNEHCGKALALAVRSTRRTLCALALMLPGMLLQAQPAPSADSMIGCTGQFPNFVTDVCWSCMLPMKVGGATLFVDGQEDIDTGAGANPLCFCDNPVFAGIPVSFWEPARMIEVVRKPFCFPILGGTAMPDPLGAPRGERKSATSFAFYQAHWYKSPLAVVMQVLLDYDLCLETGALDVAYLTELDPLWSDSELTQILNPDVFLFANPIAQAACAADCLASTLGFPISALFWCAGCQGSMYPLTGQIPNAAGGVASSALLMQRLNAKLHRELLVWGTWGLQGSCSTFPEPIMDKTAYKFQMISPVSTTKFAIPTATPSGMTSGSTPSATAAPGAADICCSPMGRAHQIWGLAKELPMGQKDFAYLLFRKRDCCFSILGL